MNHEPMVDQREPDEGDPRGEDAPDVQDAAEAPPVARPRRRIRLIAATIATLIIIAGSVGYALNLRSDINNAAAALEDLEGEVSVLRSRVSAAGTAQTDLRSRANAIAEDVLFVRKCLGDFLFDVVIFGIFDLTTDDIPDDCKGIGNEDNFNVTE